MTEAVSCSARLMWKFFHMQAQSSRVPSFFAGSLVLCIVHVHAKHLELLRIYPCVRWFNIKRICRAFNRGALIFFNSSFQAYRAFNCQRSAPRIPVPHFLAIDSERTLTWRKCIKTLTHETSAREQVSPTRHTESRARMRLMIILMNVS